MPTILVIDDSPETLDMITTWLNNQGHITLTAKNGLDGLDQAKNHHPDLILLDVMMPGIDGIEVCRQLRSDNTTQRIPILLLTAHDPYDGRLDGLIAGANDYVSKPVDFPDLEYE